MKDHEQTKAQLIEELAQMRQRVHELEKAETERKQAEEALQESEQKYRGLFENAVVGFGITNELGQILDANQAMERITGYSREEMAHLRLPDTYADPREREKLMDILRRDGKAENVEVQLLKNSGEAYWVSLLTRVIEYNGGHAIFTAVVDISERKQAEEALRESEERLKTIMESIYDPVVITNMEGRITQFNQAFTQTLGWGEEAKGELPLEFVAERDIERAATGMMECFEKGYVRNFEFANLTKDNREVPILVSATLMKDVEGSPMGLVAVLRDITERKHAEEQIKVQLQEKEVLLKEIHHRVKNNLQTVISLLSLQSQRAQDEQVREMFDNSQSRVRTMALVHEQLYQSQDMANVDCAVFLRRIVTHLLSSIGIDPDIITVKMEAKDVILETKKAISCGLIVNELVTNSLKYAFPSGNRGEIHIALDCVDGMLTVVVSDNGVGLPEGMDFRDSPSLGLRLVNILTKQLEGTIELDRSKGTEFRIVFPCRMD